MEIAESLYYLVREDFNAGRDPDARENDKYLNGAIECLEKAGPDRPQLREVELRALVNAAKRRGRLEELDRIFLCPGCDESAQSINGSVAFDTG